MYGPILFLFQTWINLNDEQPWFVMAGFVLNSKLCEVLHLCTIRNSTCVLLPGLQKYLFLSDTIIITASIRKSTHLICGFGIGNLLYWYQDQVCGILL